MAPTQPMHYTCHSNTAWPTNLVFILNCLHLVSDIAPRMQRNRSQMFEIGNYLIVNLILQMDQ